MIAAGSIAISPQDFVGSYLPRVQRELQQKSLEPQWRQIGRLIGQAEGRNFAAAASADGSAWPPRKNKKLRHPLLILTGALFQSVTSEFGQDHVERVGFRSLDWGTKVPYAAVHEFGSKKRNIPQREFMAVPDETIAEAHTILSDALDDIFYE